MKYYFIAGEASGDLHAANCMRELLQIDPSAQFAFTGGDKMEEVSRRKACIHINRMAFMGFVDVLKNIGKIKQNFKTVKQDILAFKPDLLVLVDYPGFNLRMAKWASSQNIKVDYYISPTVWAWKESRVEIIRAFVHRLYVILPFEQAFYQKHGIAVSFTGHPLVDEITRKRGNMKSPAEFIKEHGFGQKPIVAVLPGSRIQEIDRMLDVMVEVVKHFPDYQFVIAGSSLLPAKYYEGLREKKIGVVFNQTYELMAAASAGIIKSGTSTLESALMNLPQVVCYKTGTVSFAIGKRLVKLKFISLPNLIMNKEVVKELVQQDFTVAAICSELKRLLTDEKYRQSMQEHYAAIPALLNGDGASARLAQGLFDDVTKN